MDSSSLLFLISQPRSGSTLIQKLLSNHPEIATANEPWIMLKWAGVFTDHLIRSPYDHHVASQAYKSYVEKNDLPPVNEYLREIICPLYLKAKGKATYFLDKTPRYYEILTPLREIFPNAKYIVIKRNPAAVLNSMLETWNKKKLDMQKILSFERDFMVAPFELLSFSKQDNVRNIVYETLVNDPSSCLQDIFEWLNLPFSDSFVNIASNKETAGQYGDDIYEIKRSEEYKIRPVSGSVDKWTGNLNNTTGQFIQGYLHHLGPEFMTEYGYQEVYEKYAHRSSIFDHFMFLKEQPEFLNMTLGKLLRYQFKKMTNFNF